MSEREYSAHSGLSCAIQKARRASRLVVYSDGSINAATSDVRRAEMTDPDQQRRSTGGDSGLSGPADSSSNLKARTALTVYKAQDKQQGIQNKKGSPGQAVFEPFMGSGTTLIAAETTGRVCFGIELNPAYVDVATERWQSFTGQEAVLADTAESFAALRAKRLAA